MFPTNAGSAGPASGASQFNPPTMPGGHPPMGNPMIQQMAQGAAQSPSSLPNQQSQAQVGAGGADASAIMPGQTGDATKPLLSAIQNLHAYISMISDPREIVMIRQLISMLTNIIQRDQTRATQNPNNMQLPTNSTLKTPTPI